MIVKVSFLYCNSIKAQLGAAARCSYVSMAMIYPVSLPRFTSPYTLLIFKSSCPEFVYPSAEWIAVSQAFREIIGAEETATSRAAGARCTDTFSAAVSVDLAISQASLSFCKALIGIGCLPELPPRWMEALVEFSFTLVHTAIPPRSWLWPD